MTTTYSIARDGLADLALPVELDDQLRAALDSDDGPAIEQKIDERINVRLERFGVSNDGEWLGDWSAQEVVEATLREGAAQHVHAFHEYIPDDSDEERDRMLCACGEETWL